MKGDVLIGQLVRKRRELVRDIRQHEAAIAGLRLDVEAMDRVLLCWRPEIDVGAIPPLEPYDSAGVKPGALSRCILTALRMADGPLPLTDLTRQVMAARGCSGETLLDHKRRVRKSLDKLKSRSLVASREDGNRLQWEVVR